MSPSSPASKTVLSPSSSTSSKPVSRNTSSASENPPFPTPTISTLTLPHKPNAKIAYTYYAPSPSTPKHPNPFSNTLLVFVNGLLLPRTQWDPTMHCFLTSRLNPQALPYPALLSYDRYGQGDSDRDPDDPPTTEDAPVHGHDCQDAANTLHEVLTAIDDLYNPSTTFPTLIFVGQSIGCSIARLYAQSHPGSATGFLFLDSTIANSDFLSFWPDPDEPNFNPQYLPSGTTVADLRHARETYKRLFHPTVPNKENLSRRNLATLLPFSDAPKLVGPHKSDPYITVAGHDWEEFAQQNWDGLQIPKALTMAYVNPAWRQYNEGLTRLTDPDRAIGPVTAVGAGHFIQRDKPDFVAGEMSALLERITNRVEQLEWVEKGQGGRGRGWGG